MRGSLKLTLIASIVAAVTIVGVAADAKCARHQISISGKIREGKSPGLHIVVVATFSRGETAVAITDPSEGEFQASLRFDTYKSRGLFHVDNCSRRPKTITVILFQDERETDRVELDLSRDFTFVPENTEYKLTRDLVLDPGRSGDEHN